MAQSEYSPPESQVLDCISQLQANKECTYGERIRQLAKLRLADFSLLLNEWRVPSNLPHGEPLLPVANALAQDELSAEQGAKIVSFLQQHAKQGNRTALLYLAYLLAKGQFLPQSPAKAGYYVKKLMQQGDWRATRFWAEMLHAAPELAEEWLKDEVEPAAQQWQATHTQLSVEEVQANVRRFYLAEPAIKFAVKRAFEQAVAQGSPTAAKRLRGLTVLGELPVSQPARQFQNIRYFLDLQASSKNKPVIDDEDIYVLPENVPLLVQNDEEDKPLWVKPTVYACVGVIFALLFVLILRVIMHK